LNEKLAASSTGYTALDISKQYSSKMEMNETEKKDY